VGFSVFAGRFSKRFSMSSTTGKTFGFTADRWEKGKREAICAIVRAGRKGDLIFYSELSKQILSIAVEPHSYAMDHLLDEISKEEDAAGRGILTAIVVLKDEKVPADGFWRSAADLGRDVSDKWAFWSEEVKRVMEQCKKHPLCP
jgi:hypothetical protein